MAGAATCIIFVVTKFCHDKHVFTMTNMCLSWQNMSFVATKVYQKYACTSCSDKKKKIMTELCLSRQSIFVAINICLDKHVFVTTKLLSWQAYFYCNKEAFCCDKCVHHDKSKLVMIKLLSWQNYVCHDKYLSWQKYVMTKVLSQQAYFCHDKRCALWQQTSVCHNKTFVTPKMILLAAPANHNPALV